MSEAEPASEQGSLCGIGVLNTRDVRQASDLSELLRARGASVFEFPVLEIIAPESSEQLDEALSHLERYNWIVFASTNAVDFFTSRMKILEIQHSSLSQCLLAAVGTRTAQRLELHGLEADFCPAIFSASAFVQEFCQKFPVENQTFLWPRTNVGKLTIKDGLELKGGRVDAVVAYETHLPTSSETRQSELADLVNSNAVQVITLTSSQAAKNFKKLLAERTISPGTIIATIGTETHKTAKALFECQCIQSEEFSIPGLVAAITSYMQNISSELQR